MRLSQSSPSLLSLDNYLSLLEVCACLVNERRINEKKTVLPEHKSALLGSGLSSLRALKYLLNPPIHQNTAIQMDVLSRYLEKFKFSQKTAGAGSEAQICEFTWKDFLMSFEPSTSTSYLKLRKRNRKAGLSSFLIRKILHFWPEFDDIFEKLGLMEEDWIVYLIYLFIDLDRKICIRV